MNRSDEETFAAFVTASGDGLLRYARLLFADRGEAEDAVQTALLRLAGQWPRGLDAPLAYTRTALRNLATDSGRRRHLVARPTDVEPAPPPGPDLAEAHAAAARLDELLEALPPRQRVTVLLRIVDGLTEAETAQAMRCSPGTVKSNLSRGLARLRERLDATAESERTCR